MWFWGSMGGKNFPWKVDNLKNFLAPRKGRREKKKKQRGVILGVFWANFFGDKRITLLLIGEKMGVGDRKEGKKEKIKKFWERKNPGTNPPVGRTIKRFPGKVFG